MPTKHPLDFVHVGRELAESFIEVVHLRQNAGNRYDYEDVGGRVCELVVPSKSHLERNTERFDRHDGYGAGRRADGEVD
jgi:hypothetical protein